MNTEISNQNVNTLMHSNAELMRALSQFIELSPTTKSLYSQLSNIKSTLKSNDAMSTFAALVKQYAKIKKNVDHVDHQSQKKDLNRFKETIIQAAKKRFSPPQVEKIEGITAKLSPEQPADTLLAVAGKAVEYFANDIANTCKSTNVANNPSTPKAKNIIATDVHLVSNKLIKSITIIAKKLAQTYPEDAFIDNLLLEAAQVSSDKAALFKSINLIERTATYLTLLIQQERYAAETMLNDIHTNLISAFNRTTVIQHLAKSAKDNNDNMTHAMMLGLKKMETKANSIDTTKGMQIHIKESMQLLSDIMNTFAEKQSETHTQHENTIEQLSQQIENTSNFVNKLEQQLNDAEETSLIDELTTVNNRKGYVLKINEERQNWQQSKQPLALMVIDVDHFKNINDSYGHSIGDQVLKSLAQTLQKNIRSTDYLARYGGEEFVIILPATDLVKTARIAQKLREAVNKIKFELRKKNKTLTITCSFGISIFTDKNATSTDAFNVADKALYQAKNNGRDAIVLAKDEHMVDVALAHTI